MPRRVAPYRLAGGVALAAAFLYLSFPAARYNFDGVAAAIAVELGDFKHLLHGNHLVYGFAGHLFCGIFRAVGVALPALQELQLLSSLLGAAAAGVFTLILLERGLDPFLAALGGAGLAVSRIYWIWSLEAQVYSLGAFFLFCAAREALRPDPRPARLGLLHAGAVLGHVGHLMFLPAVWHLLRGRGERLRYLAALGGGVFAAYAAAAALVMRPGSWEEWRVWLLGSAALSVDRSFGWHGGYSWAGLKDWIRVSLQMTGAGAACSLALIAAAAAGALAARNAQARAARACLLWLAGYAALYLCWEPYTPVYRVTDLAPLWLLALLAVENLPGSRAAKLAALAAFTAVLGVSNLKEEILPASDPGRNADLQRSLRIARSTPENAWIIVDGIDQVYVPYFAHRRPINLRYYQGKEEKLLRRIAALRLSGEPVFAAPQALPEAWRDKLRGRSSGVKLIQWSGEGKK